MIKTSLKLTAVAAMLAGASVAANAATTDLGAISGTDPKTFSGVVQGSGTSINDIFTFSLDQNNVSSGYSVVNIPLSFTGGDYLDPLLHTTIGQVFLVIGVVLVIIGSYSIKKIAEVEV